MRATVSGNHCTGLPAVLAAILWAATGSISPAIRMLIVF
jgi:hypothetical protein